MKGNSGTSGLPFLYSARDSTPLLSIQFKHSCRYKRLWNHLKIRAYQSLDVKA